MDAVLRPFRSDDLESVVALSLRAWAPFFGRLPELVGERLADALHTDWRSDQSQVVTGGCTDPGHVVTVAELDGAVVGFAVVTLDEREATGDLHLIAVDPDAQRRGIGAALNAWALDTMRAAGMRLAHVGTGGDPTHATARRSYERAGYVPIPVVHYYRLLDELS